MQNEYQLKTNKDIVPKVSTGSILVFEDSADQPFYQVEIPVLGDLWCLSKTHLIQWLRDAANMLENNDWDDEVE